MLPSDRQHNSMLERVFAPGDLIFNLCFAAPNGGENAKIFEISLDLLCVPDLNYGMNEAIGESKKDRKRATLPGMASPPFAERLSFGIHQLSAQMARISNPLFRKYGIDIPSSRILVLALEEEGVGASRVIDLLRLPQSTTSHQFQRLEKLGYLYRQRDHTDQRMVTIHLTQNGRHVANACNQLSIEVYQLMIRHLRAAEIHLARDILERMLEGINQLGVVNLTD